MTAAELTGSPAGAGVLRSVRWIRAGVALALALIATLLSSAPAWAHASLRSTNPAEGSVLTNAPRQITLTFNEPIGPAAEGFVLYGPDGARYTLPATGSDSEVSADVPEGLAQGTFQLDWRVVSVDSHPLTGTLTFSIGAAGVLPDRTATAGDDGVVALAFRVAQFAAYLGLITMLGLTLFNLVVDRRAAGRSRFGRLIGLAGLLAVLGHLLLIPLTYQRQQGLPLSDLFRPGVWGGELWTSQGLALLLVLVGTGAVLAAARVPAARVPAARVPGARVSAAGRVLATAGVLVAAASVTVVGHTRGPKSNPLMVASDFVHVCAASVWFGGLAALLITLRSSFAARRQLDHSTDPTGGPAGAAMLVARFSLVAGWTVAALGVSGVVMAWTVLDDWDSLLHTGYGQSLLIKVALVLGAVLIAFWNRSKLVPAVAAARGSASRGVPAVRRDTAAGTAESPSAAANSGPGEMSAGRVQTVERSEEDDEPAWRTLKVLLLAELVVLTVVVAVTALLVSLSPVREAAAAPPVSAAEPLTGGLTALVFDFDLPLTEGSVTGQVKPMVVGLNALRFTLRDSSGAATDPVDLPKLRLLPADGSNVGSIEVQPRYADITGEFAADLRIVAAGAWTLEIEAPMTGGTYTAAISFVIDG